MEFIKLTRNKWQITPLERINNAIIEVSKKISELKKERENTMKLNEKAKLEGEIQELRATLESLKVEAENRAKKVKQFKKKRRHNLMHTLNRNHRLTE